MWKGRGLAPGKREAGQQSWPTEALLPDEGGLGAGCLQSGVSASASVTLCSFHFKGSECSPCQDGCWLTCNALIRLSKSPLFSPGPPSGPGKGLALSSLGLSLLTISEASLPAFPPFLFLWIPFPAPPSCSGCHTLCEAISTMAPGQRAVGPCPSPSCRLAVCFLGVSPSRFS